MDYTPVCAGPVGGPYKTYGNDCARAYQACTDNISKALQIFFYDFEFANFFFLFRTSC